MSLISEEIIERNKNKMAKYAVGAAVAIVAYHIISKKYVTNYTNIAIAGIGAALVAVPIVVTPKVQAIPEWTDDVMFVAGFGMIALGVYQELKKRGLIPQ